MAILTQDLFTVKSDVVVSENGWFLDFGETVDALAGNDTITGSSSGIGAYGIYNVGTIDTGAGSDTITGTTGIEGNSIFNLEAGTIDTGAGDDTITGTARIGGTGIFNGGGTIDTGAGNDTVNALVGGFGGLGITDLGTGSDTLKGFGEGTFIGGNGNDKILFGEGIYDINGGTITSGGIDMNVSSFERIGALKGKLFGFADGTLTVNADGFAAFA